MIPAYEVYQKNKSQGHDCFENFSKKPYQFILSTQKGTCTSTV